MCTFWSFRTVQVTQRQSTTVSLEKTGDNIRDPGCDLGQQGSAIRREVSQAARLELDSALVSLSAECTDGIGFVSKVLVYLEIRNGRVCEGAH